LLLLTVAACSTGPAEAVIEVLEVSGPLDNAALRFIESQITDATDAGRELIVVQLDSPGVIGDDATLREVTALVAHPPVPVVVWVGPAPAVAYGDALRLLEAASLGTAAPGVLLEVGDIIEVSGPVVGLVDEVQPSLQQLLQALDGRKVGGGTLSTLRPIDGGISTRSVIFTEPDLGTRFLRLAVRPEATFFFLVVGLTVAVFEFYAAGPGIAAGVAGLSLFLASYGLSVLPVRLPAVALAILGWILLTASFQRGTMTVLVTAGTAAMVAGGVWLVDADTGIAPNLLGVFGSVAAVLFFFLLAMPAVARARFSTHTIGRDHLVGRPGLAVTDFSPDGVAEVAGARWKASAHRESGLRRGDALRVLSVAADVLEVAPDRKGREI
jgi:membrane-bound serine protease (ClpP class)